MGARVAERMGGSMGQWVGSGHITKYRIHLVWVNEWVNGWGSVQMTNLIKLELINIIQFCLKIYDLWRHPNYGWVNGWAHVKSLKSNKS